MNVALRNTQRELDVAKVKADVAYQKGQHLTIEMTRELDDLKKVYYMYLCINLHYH